MTREIKKPRGFRVWYKKEKRWLRPDEFKINADGTVSTFGLYCSQAELVRCDSSGLHDKNGKEIFEGDIVRYRYPSMRGADFRGAVIWGVEDGVPKFHLQGKERNGEDWYTNFPLVKDIEVVGNVWENPESLPTPTQERRT